MGMICDWWMVVSMLVWGVGMICDWWMVCDGMFFVCVCCVYLVWVYCGDYSLCFLCGFWGILGMFYGLCDVGFIFHWFYVCILYGYVMLVLCFWIVYYVYLVC